MRVWIPPGTAVVKEGCRVVLLFHREQEAQSFIEWLKWMDEQPSGTNMAIKRPEEESPTQ